MKVVAYVDESGCHDRTGRLEGSSVAVMTGFVALRDEWAEFCPKWQSVLNKHDAQFFHFYDWSTASRVLRNIIKPPSRFLSNPYKDWTLAKLDDFFYELAEIAGSGDKIIAGGYVYTADFHKSKSVAKNPLSVPGGGDPYRFLAEKFFEDLPHDIQVAWPHWKEPIAIFYDEPDPAWMKVIFQSYAKHKKKDARIAELSFADKKDHLPLQAADLLAYRIRQVAENQRDGKLQLTPVPKLDKLIWKTMFDKFDRDGVEKYIPKT